MADAYSLVEELRQEGDGRPVELAVFNEMLVNVPPS
jgi:hypothetical protein